MSDEDVAEMNKLEKERYDYAKKYYLEEVSADIPTRFKDNNFGNYNTSQSLAGKVEKCKDYAVDYQKHLETGNSLYLFGKVGNGKTHLAISVIKLIAQMEAKRKADTDRENGDLKDPAALRDENYFSRHCYSDNYCFFIEGPSFFQQIRDSFSNQVDEQEQLMRQVRNCKFLVWDDILAERPTKWLLEQMHIIINHRYLEMKPTIFTSNLPPDKFNKIAQNEKFMMGQRIFSRLADMCKGNIVKFDFEDYRMRG